MLPAALFVAAGGLLYYDKVIPNNFQPNESNQLTIWLIFILIATFIMWIGFALYSTVNLTVRLYEGYYLPPRIRKILVNLFFVKSHRRKTQYIREIFRIHKEMPSNWKELIGRYYEQAWADYADIELSSPIREDDLLPSMLGNVLRASEQYSQKYGLKAGIDIWTRLSVLLPPVMANELEEKNNNIIFLLNSSLLSYMHSLIAFVIWLIFRIDSVCSQVGSCVGTGTIKEIINYPIFSNSEAKYLFYFAAWFVIGYVLYVFSIPVAKTFGLLIRTSFDLYRFDLLKQLNYEIPKKLSRERSLWWKISDFIVTGGVLGTQPLEFEYNLRNEYVIKKNQPSKPLGRKNHKKSK